MREGLSIRTHQGCLRPRKPRVFDFPGFSSVVGLPQRRTEAPRHSSLSHVRQLRGSRVDSSEKQSVCLR